jgi:hypothetical protein
MPISWISSVSGTVLNEKALAEIGRPKKLEETNSSRAVPTTKRLNVTDTTTATNVTTRTQAAPTAQAAKPAPTQTMTGASEEKGETMPELREGRLDIKA